MMLGPREMICFYNKAMILLSMGFPFLFLNVMLILSWVWSRINWSIFSPNPIPFVQLFLIKLHSVVILICSSLISNSPFCPILSVTIWYSKILATIVMLMFFACMATDLSPVTSRTWVFQFIDAYWVMLERFILMWMRSTVLSYVMLGTWKPFRKPFIESPFNDNCLFTKSVEVVTNTSGM